MNDYVVNYICSGCGREQESKRNSYEGIPRCGTCNQNMIPEGRLREPPAPEPIPRSSNIGGKPTSTPTPKTASLLDAIRKCGSHRR